MNFRQQLITTLLIFAPLSLIPTTCRGQLMYTNISREVTAIALGCLPDEQSASSTETGLFSESFFVSSFEDGCEFFSDANAFQDTLVSPLEISGNGGITGTSVGPARAEGVSRLEADFIVQATLPYLLNGAVGGFVFGGSGEMMPSPTRLVLESNGEALHSVMQEQAPMPTSFDFSGQLPPGKYTLLVDAPALAIDGVADSQFDFSFVVPEPMFGQPLLILISCMLRRRKISNQ